MIKEQEGDVDLAISIAKETCQVYNHCFFSPIVLHFWSLIQVAVSYRAVSDALDAATVLKDKIAPFWISMVKV